MFDNVISLGGNCLVSAALGKYGLRSASGPFDWCVSDFMQGIIPVLENDFEDYMVSPNLEVPPEDEKYFTIENIR
jgi:hypothetical protein